MLELVPHLFSDDWIEIDPIREFVGDLHPKPNY